MYSKLALFVAASMAAFVAAAPGLSAPGSINNSCDGGKVQCCNSIQSAQSPAAQQAAGDFPGLAAILADLGAGANVGLTCSPITALGIQGNNCASQPVCCSNNSFNGLIALGCSPINANL